MSICTACYTKLVVKKQIASSVWVNGVGAIGYMLLVTVWVLFVAVIFGLMIDPSSAGAPLEVEKMPSGMSTGELSGGVLVAGYAITVLIGVICVALLITLPYFIGKIGGRVLRWSLRQFKISISRRTLLFVKSIVLLAPLVGFIGIQVFVSPDSTTFAAMFVMSLAVVTLGLVAFLVQLLLARHFTLPLDKQW